MAYKHLLIATKLISYPIMGKESTEGTAPQVYQFETPHGIKDKDFTLENLRAVLEAHDLKLDDGYRYQLISLHDRWPVIDLGLKT